MVKTETIEQSRRQVSLVLRGSVQKSDTELHTQWPCSLVKHFTIVLDSQLVILLLSETESKKEGFSGISGETLLFH